MIRARVAIAQATMSDNTVKLTWRIAEFGKRLAGSVTVPREIAPAFAAWLRAGAVWLRRGERLP
jgi:hypothetical protein